MAKDPNRKPRIRAGPTWGEGHGVSATIEVGLPLVAVGGLFIAVAITNGKLWIYAVGIALAALGFSFMMRGGKI